MGRALSCLGSTVCSPAAPGPAWPFGAAPKPSPCFWYLCHTLPVGDAHPELRSLCSLGLQVGAAYLQLQLSPAVSSQDRPPPGGVTL